MRMNTTVVTGPEAPVFATARRINQSLTAAVEKRALTWMAEHAPRWVTSDGLTLLGLLAQFGAGAFYFFSRYDKSALVGVVVCIVLNWFGDSMDGTLARVRNQQRPRYGFYIDHMLDSIGALALMGGLAVSGLMHPVIAVGLLVLFLLLSIQSYLATYTLGEFRMSFLSFG